METQSQLKTQPDNDSGTSPGPPEAHDLNSSYAQARKRKSDSDDPAQLVTPTKPKKRHKKQTKANLPTKANSPIKVKEEKKKPVENKERSKTDNSKIPKAKPKTHNAQLRIENFYPSKTLKADTYLQGYDGVCMLDMLKDPPQEIFYKDVAFGLFTLVYVNKFNLDTEGNVYPILRALGSVRDVGNSYSKTPPGVDEEFSGGNRICAIAPRRISKSNNIAVTKHVGKGTNDRIYRECVFVVAMQDNTFDNKRKLLLEIIEFLKQNGVQTETRMNPNMTDNHVQSMDHYLPDETIIHLIRKFWKGISDTTFYDQYKQCPEICDAFFSPPYPTIAHTELGYPLANQESADTAKPQMTPPEFDNLDLEEEFEGEGKADNPIDMVDESDN